MGRIVDSFSSAPTLVLPVKCDNGKTGEAIVTRQRDLLSGSAIVRLSDGTRGQFVYGDLKFEQAFGSGTARTQ